ncbi:kynureninase [Mesorhizobium sp. SB112]|uniref:kynureninase n=1 Tax=Mesorhizobium sp. SB112 TaxID=3151853 RepID=UPI0032666D12
MTIDIFERTKALFDLPEGIVYLDGNSLGPLPKAARQRVLTEIDEGWGKSLIRGWNDRDWIGLQASTGDRIAKLIGAPAGSVIASDSTSINLFKALTAALESAGERKIVLSDSGNFPNDLYVAQGALAALDKFYVLKIVAPEEIADAITDEVAVLMITQVDYRTGRLHDMEALTAKARAKGVLTIWDLCHSAGALPVELERCGVDFAVGCGYKYLNGGPGAPAFIYVRPGLADSVKPSLAGWMGHDAPFAFDLEYRPAKGIDRMRVGTPPILSLAALHTALEVWEGVDLHALRARSIALCDRFIEEVERRCPDLELVTPRDAAMRGSQVSFRFHEGYAAMQAVIAQGVIGDFRAPDMMRFGFTPLYIGIDDVLEAAGRLERVMREKLWDRPEYRNKNKVT